MHATKNIYRLLAILIALLAVSGNVLHAQFEDEKIDWKLLTPTISGKPGDVVEIKIYAGIKDGNHMYSTKKYPAEALGPASTEITVGEKGVITRKGGATPNKKPVNKYDENFEIETEYWASPVTIAIPVKISERAKPGKVEAWANIYFQTCDERSCRPPLDKRFTVKVEVLQGDSADQTTSDSDTDALLQQGADSGARAGVDTMKGAVAESTHVTVSPLPTRTAPPEEAYSPTGGLDDIRRAREEGLWEYLGLSAMMGGLALLTPCVFPMIPITVSFFTKREQSSKERTVRDAFLYSVGIILTFTAIGFLFTLVLGATGINDFATNPIVNLVVAGVFIVLALSLFGMFEIQIPSGILNKLNAKASSGDGGVISIMLMGLVFSLTSFTCTVPFVGGLMVSSASGGDVLWPLMGMAVFAAVFSTPFFLLALFPALLKSLPKSGGWLNSVKVVMGFLEIAAAIKFLSNSDLVWQWGVLTREFFLAIWVALAVFSSVYLLGKFKLPHDSPVDRVGPLRMMLSAGALAVGLWLVMGMFGGKLGELDAFLPPQEYPGKGNTSIMAGLGSGSGTGEAAEQQEWLVDDYSEALMLAKKNGKPIFVDFTGYTCTNCRWMEANMFTRPDVDELMDKFVLVRLYTDGRNAINKKNRTMQIDRFETIALPYYAIITPQDSVIGTFDGMTRQPQQFISFLQKGVPQASEGKLAETLR